MLSADTLVTLAAVGSVLRAEWVVAVRTGVCVGGAEGVLAGYTVLGVGRTERISALGTERYVVAADRFVATGTGRGVGGTGRSVTRGAVDGMASTDGFGTRGAVVGVGAADGVATLGAGGEVVVTGPAVAAAAVCEMLVAKALLAISTGRGVFRTVGTAAVPTGSLLVGADLIPTLRARCNVVGADRSVAGVALDAVLCTVEAIAVETGGAVVCTDRSRAGRAVCNVAFARPGIADFARGGMLGAAFPITDVAGDKVGGGVEALAVRAVPGMRRTQVAGAIVHCDAVGLAELPLADDADAKVGVTGGVATLLTSPDVLVAVRLVVRGTGGEVVVAVVAATRAACRPTERAGGRSICAARLEMRGTDDTVTTTTGLLAVRAFDHSTVCARDRAFGTTGVCPAVITGVQTGGADDVAVRTDGWRVALGELCVAGVAREAPELVCCGRIVDVRCAGSSIEVVFELKRTGLVGDDGGADV